ncbi:LacI family transcriptional regulator [Streptomyces ipomoeae]|uniref:Periplasmic binding protein and sugar binding domain of the LacI family protein n=2 Tax=Streptomyces ipomoeae TaxID=103232 RepID=L1KQF6_9ACTN|nr:LacI family DNA-binding transcriptional regulator [Streptomyces ipomoeae]EKX62827.1 periplasmic binding protein and sugar binding domain of the LacI family protein [Streptomyces ipomoeae 91-03]MDX2692493.1 LacI family DNA-binding transcriptional regulator [Streptomyces ipomoeae]MDX2838166.1 LacI family DNA-binding transcriptional regulator [Streptomyces ipomoeae]MDX2933740.1 LacI family DNA-binding transcriptional regulator [Streptomyces ipomoeae]TQE25838.1 LacI family transcriptional regul
MAPTLTDVAKQANVALSTASRAFSEPERLGTETLRKVREAAEQLGYEPSPRPVVWRPEQDATTATASVAVVVPDIADPVYGIFVKAAQAQGRHRRQTIVLADTDHDPDHERQAITRLGAGSAGIVVCAPRLDAEEVVDLCGDTPVVLVDRETTAADCVLTDAADGLRQTAEYLAALGHTHLAYVPGAQHSWAGGHRLDLARTHAEQADLVLEVLGRQSETVAGGTAAAAGVIASGASAVIAHNDSIALGIIAGARRLGFRVPDDLGVVGIGDTPLAEIADPSLTSIAVPMDRAGSLSLELLAQSAAGERRKPRTLRLPTQLVVRGSTGPVAGRAGRAAGRPTTR